MHSSTSRDVTWLLWRLSYALKAFLDCLCSFTLALYHIGHKRCACPCSQAFTIFLGHQVRYRLSDFGLLFCSYSFTDPFQTGLLLTFWSMAVVCFLVTYRAATAQVATHQSYYRYHTIAPCIGLTLIRQRRVKGPPQPNAEKIPSFPWRYGSWCSNPRCSSDTTTSVSRLPVTHSNMSHSHSCTGTSLSP